MLSIFKKMTVHTFMLAFNSPSCVWFYCISCFLLPLESHKQTTILQAIPGAFLSKLIVCKNHEMHTLITTQLIKVEKNIERSSTWVINEDWKNTVKPHISKCPQHGPEVWSCQSSLFEHSVAYIWHGYRFLHQHQPLCWWKSNLGNSHSIIHVDSKHSILPQSKGEKV